VVEDLPGDGDKVGDVLGHAVTDTGVFLHLDPLARG